MRSGFHIVGFGHRHAAPEIYEVVDRQYYALLVVGEKAWEVRYILYAITRSTK
jgi:hypothetical protein